MAPPILLFWATLPTLLAAQCVAAQFGASYLRGFASASAQLHQVVALPRSFHRSHPMGAQTGRGEVVALVAGRRKARA